MSPMDLGPEQCPARRETYRCHRLSGHGSDPHHDVVMGRKWYDDEPYGAQLYRPLSGVVMPSAAFMACRCGGTGRIPMPPRGSPPFHQEFLCELPCPECRERVETHGAPEQRDHRDQPAAADLAREPGPPDRDGLGEDCCLGGGCSRP